jgi:hypothetical protein
MHDCSYPKIIWWIDQSLLQKRARLTHEIELIILTRRQAGELKVSQVEHLSLCSGGSRGLLHGHQWQGDGSSNGGNNSRWLGFSYGTRQGRGHIVRVPVRSRWGGVDIINYDCALV